MIIKKKKLQLIDKQGNFDMLVFRKLSKKADKLQQKTIKEAEKIQQLQSPKKRN